MHFCTAMISLAGDDQQKVYRSQFKPVSWPELEVLQAVHGPGSVNDVRPFVRVDQEPRAERDRLSLIYGKEIIEGGSPQVIPVYPGRTPNMDMEAPDITVMFGATWLNPLSGDLEMIQDDGSSVPIPKGPLVIDEFNAPPAPQQQVFGDPRLGDPDTGMTRAKTGRERSGRARYDDNNPSPFAT
jgi:hypothetical protein